ncbi:ABC transporter ATP-binding protein [uncultured Bacteroides sp.]|uniref:ABC transporter ATP-binding protein n=1 Tax=uncultured Bacteroides sp. TaxID=162156 RepID=UPI002AAA6836|nr:ABC transporter ATP-binding protein [uncultured Bacteroides sp.]
MPDAIIQTHDLTIGYANRKATYPVQIRLSLEVFQGEMVCLIGPNGCGKSTLLRTLAGLQPPLRGEVCIDNLPLGKQSLSNKAKLLSLVLTDRVEVSNLTVFNLVAMGRNPYTDWLGKLTDHDKELVHTALTQVHLEGYAGRFINELSDGERQRAMIAKALVQDTPVILLDEPTAHLDINNRVEVMMLLHELARHTNKAIVLSTHELDLALQTADKLWLMTPKHGIAVGTPEDLILTNRFQKVFANDAYRFDPSTGNFMVNHAETPRLISLKTLGTGYRTYWTERALIRSGYKISPEATGTITVDEATDSWLISKDGKELACSSLQELLMQMNSF